MQQYTIATRWIRYVRSAHARRPVFDCTKEASHAAKELIAEEAPSSAKATIAGIARTAKTLMSQRK
jgi:hypothetical protein